jgi:hypothetical protein
LPRSRIRFAISEFVSGYTKAKDIHRVYAIPDPVAGLALEALLKAKGKCFSWFRFFYE